MTGNAHLDLKLSANNRCRCSGCGEHFNSVGAFDKHRTIDNGERRCMTIAEMQELGMAMNAAQYWVTSLSDFDWGNAA